MAKEPPIGIQTHKHYLFVGFRNETIKYVVPRVLNYLRTKFYPNQYLPTYSGFNVKSLLSHLFIS